MDIRKLDSRQREAIFSRNAKQSEQNAERKKQHEDVKNRFFDKKAEQMEPIVWNHLRQEGQIRKNF